MANKNDNPASDAPVAKTLKQCPDCTATMFQGPFIRGPIENGKHVKREELYQCVNCHHVWPVDQLNDFEVPTA